MKPTATDEYCTQVADEVVPEYRHGKRSYSCTGVVAKRWQAAWDAAHRVLVGPNAAHRVLGGSK